MIVVCCLQIIFTLPTILLPGIDPGTPTYKIDMITISNTGVYLHTLCPKMEDECHKTDLNPQQRHSGRTL